MKKHFNKLSFFPKKRLGQNFLHDIKIVNMILNHIPGCKDLSFIEIGPGLGALTIPFVKIHRKLLIAIEIDPYLVQCLLKYPFINNKLIIYQQDVLNFDFIKYYYSQPKRLKLCIFGNLPYKIVTKLLFHLFNHLSVIDSMYFMVQKEVGERIVAYPNNKEYGKLTVLLQYFCKSQYLFDIYNSSFYPKPKINSAFIKLIPNKYYDYFDDSDFKAIFKLIVTLAFKKRRKMLSNSLKVIKNIKTILMTLYIDPNLRAEDLSFNKYYQICKYIFHNMKNIQILKNLSALHHFN